MNTSEEITALLAPPVDELVYHLDDIAGQIAAAPLETWEAIAALWSMQGADWKSCASMIIDRLDSSRKAILLREIIGSQAEENAALAANLVSQIGQAQIGDWQPLVVTYLERSWHEFPALRDYVVICSKAGGLNLRVGA
ncbi:hypothetical protein LL974_09425 [Xanthomonas campestris pv. cannae]|nr:hypothetical protein [Xanthomonas campestris pv. cannae]